MHREFYLGNLWRWKCGLKERTLPEYGKAPSIDFLERTQWDDQFARLMKNRLILGCLRYGRNKSIQNSDLEKRDYRIDIMRRARLYLHTGDIEQLVDIANVALLEFVKQRKRGVKMQSTEDAYHTPDVKEN